LSQTGAKEAARTVSGTAQYGTVRQPDHDRGPGKKQQMERACHGPQRSAAAGSHGQQQLRLESDMGELIGNESATENLQAPAIRSRLQCAVIDGPNQLGADENGEIQLQPRKPSYATKNPIRPVASLQRYAVILHEGPQQRCMTSFFSNQQVDDPHQMRHLIRPREAFCRSQQRPPIGLLAELKRCDGARDELQFVGRQNVGKTVRYPARTQGVMFEVIQPDLQISRTHAATLPIALIPRVRVHSGIPVREFGQIVAGGASCRRGRHPSTHAAARPGQIQNYGQAAIFAIGELNAAAMGLGDFPSQRKADAGAAALGRIEGQQRLRKYGLTHAAAAVANLDALLDAVAGKQQIDRIGRAAGFVRVFQEIDDRLLHLHPIANRPHRP